MSVESHCWTHTTVFVKSNDLPHPRPWTAYRGFLRGRRHTIAVHLDAQPVRPLSVEIYAHNAAAQWPPVTSPAERISVRACVRAFWWMIRQLKIRSASNWESINANSACMQTNVSRLRVCVCVYCIYECMCRLQSAEHIIVVYTECIRSSSCVYYCSIRRTYDAHVSDYECMWWTTRAPSYTHAHTQTYTHPHGCANLANSRLRQRHRVLIYSFCCSLLTAMYDTTTVCMSTIHTHWTHKHTVIVMNAVWCPSMYVLY